jgi:ribonuclease HI
MEEYILYTDGSCYPNPGKGGLAYILLNTKMEVLTTYSETENNTTNNRMEMLATVRGLEHIKIKSRIIICTDSQYVTDGATKWLKNWVKRDWVSKNKEKTPIKNQDLWQRIDQLQNYHDITWKWIRGHNGNMWNEKVDYLAEQARITGTQSA